MRSSYNGFSYFSTALKKNQMDNQEQKNPDSQAESTVNTTDQNDQKRAIRTGALRLFINSRDYVFEVFNLKEGAAIEQTIEGIHRDIDFKGHKAWILACSILIASIGLNTNSAAAIIGAMLISPLMGPILGMGLAIGTHDFKKLTYSARNLGIAVIISIGVSAFYFLLSPIDEPQSELMARTRPTLLDAAIAIFGGLAGIIAGSRKEKSNVVPGVAIATALMPPLCTAGFGLANLKWDFFFGAFYLFLLNSIFICLSTWIVVKYLDFPKMTFVDPLRERKYNRYIAAIVVVILIPSGWLFFGVIQETLFNSRATAFLNDNFKFEESEILSSKFSYSEDDKRIDVYMMGEPIKEETYQSLEGRMAGYGLENTVLKIHQGGMGKSEMGRMSQELRVGIIEELYKKNEQLIVSKDSTIKLLSTELESIKGDTIPIDLLGKEMRVQFPDLESFSYAKMVNTKLSGERDTVPTVILQWNPKTSTIKRAAESDRMEQWLRIRLNDSTLQVQAY